VLGPIVIKVAEPSSVPGDGRHESFDQ